MSKESIVLVDTMKSGKSTIGQGSDSEDGVSFFSQSNSNNSSRVLTRLDNCSPIIVGNAEKRQLVTNLKDTFYQVKEVKRFIR